jgi:hypothetical protein
MGAPPRKEGETAIGDAINWEWMVECVNQTNKDLIIVSRDSDFGRKQLNQPVLNDWLSQELKDRTNKRRKIVLTERLPHPREVQTRYAGDFPPVNRAGILQYYPSRCRVLGQIRRHPGGRSAAQEVLPKLLIRTTVAGIARREVVVLRVDAQAELVRLRDRVLKTACADEPTVDPREQQSERCRERKRLDYGAVDGDALIAPSTEPVIE